MWNSDKCECNAECAYECVCDWTVTPNEWHGLTTEEINKITDELNIDLILGCSISDFVKAIEAKLKEKNHGQ